MKRIVSILSVAALWAAGCTTPPKADLHAERPQARAQIRRTLDDLFDAAEKKDFVRLDNHHFYSPQFTKFATGLPHRQGPDEARQGEHDGLSAIQDLRMRAEGLKIDVFDQVGIATFILDLTFKAGTETFLQAEKGTLVFVNERGSWKIVHEHFSQIPKSL